MAKSFILLRMKFNFFMDENIVSWIFLHNQYFFSESISVHMKGQQVLVWKNEVQWGPAPDINRSITVQFHGLVDI